MPATYENSVVRFLYPENWTLDESDSGDDALTLYAPGGAFWSLIWRDLSEDPHDLAVETLETLKKEYAETEAESTSEKIASREIAGFDVSFYFLDLVNTATIRGFRTTSASCLVLCQAEDREYREMEPVFQAITTSLLQS